MNQYGEIREIIDAQDEFIKKLTSQEILLTETEANVLRDLPQKQRQQVYSDNYDRVGNWTDSPNGKLLRDALRHAQGKK